VEILTRAALNLDFKKRSHHAVDPSPIFITFGVKVLSSHLPAPDAPKKLAKMAGK
jgi:hypothetical protein